MDKIRKETIDEEIGKMEITQAENEAVLENRKKFDKDMKNIWGHSFKGAQAKSAAMSALATSTGMYARIPLVCKAEACPYASFCKLLSYGLAPEGEACPEEAALIELSHMGYDQDFNINNSSFTDRNLVATIIEYDVLIRRVQTLLSKEQDPVNEIVAGVNEVTGEEYTHPEISKYLEALDKIVKKRNDLYQLMMATRKDKKDDGENNKSIVEIVDEVIEADFIVEEKPKELD